MKRYAFRFWPFDVINYKRAEEYLEEKASRGYLLKKCNQHFACYESTGVPHALKYRTDIFPRFDVSQEFVEYLQTCEAAGWHYICGIREWQFFVSKVNETPVPLHTDPEIELMQIKKNYRRRIPEYITLAVLVLIMLFASQFSGFSETQSALHAGFAAIIALLTSIEALTTLRFYRQSEVAIVAGAPLPFLGKGSTLCLKFFKFFYFYAFLIYLVLKQFVMDTLSSQPFSLAEIFAITGIYILLFFAIWGIFFSFFAANAVEEPRKSTFWGISIVFFLCLLLVPFFLTYAYYS